MIPSRRLRPPPVRSHQPSRLTLDGGHRLPRAPRLPARRPGADPDSTVIEVRGRRIGDGFFGLIAGPCTVETREQTLETARAVAAAGVTMLRGGAFKPRSSPYAFQGLGSKGLEILVEAREETGLPIVTELLDPRDVQEVAGVADVIQIGARNMHNRDAVSDDELLVMASITHQRPPAPGASSKKYRSFRVPRTRPSGVVPAISGPVVESEARSAIRAASGSVRHDIACSTDGRLPMRS